MATRTRIEETGSNRCSITYWDDAEDRAVTLDLFAPIDGGYVKFDDGRQFPQVCEMLYGSGDTLVWYPRSGPLSALVRREWRRRRASERRDYRR